MKILSLIKPAFTVLLRGNELRNPEKWKEAQILAGFLGAVLSLAMMIFPSLNVVNADIIQLSSVALAALANNYITAATSKKVGLPPIELQAEPELFNEPHRPIPVYVPPADGRWVYQPKVQTGSETAASDDVQPISGFNDQQ